MAPFSNLEFIAVVIIGVVVITFIIRLLRRAFTKF